MTSIPMQRYMQRIQNRFQAKPAQPQYDPRFREMPQGDQTGLYQQMLDAIGQMSSQREAATREAYGQESANMMQQLARSGMAGTTVAPTMKLGVARRRESSLNELADQMLQTKLGVVGGELQRRTAQQENALQRLAGLEQAKMSGQYQLAGTSAQLQAQQYNQAEARRIQEAELRAKYPRIVTSNPSFRGLTSVMSSGYQGF